MLCDFFQDNDDIISAKEKQATLNAAFVFLALLTSKQTAKQDGKRRMRELASLYNVYEIKGGTRISAECASLRVCMICATTRAARGFVSQYGVNEMRQPSIIIHKGRRDEKYRIYIEDYALSYLKEETNTLELSGVYFYGFRENNNKRYIIYGAGRERQLEVFDKYSLLNEIGCRLTQAGPVFLVREGDDLYEIKGYEVFYQDNKEMQSYLIDLKGKINEGSPVVEENDRAAHGGRINNADMHKTAPHKVLPNKMPSNEAAPNKLPHSIVSVQLGIILVALVAIVINSTNSYDKMQQMNQSASEVFFAIENQEAENITGIGGGQDEIVVERNTAEDETVPEIMQPNEPDIGVAVSDSGREEEILKLITIENNEQAEENQDDELSGTEDNEDKVTADENAASGETDRGEPQPEESDEVEALSRNVARSYEVERGDTLYTISRKIYGDITHVEKICEVNRISDPDHIHYGQKIILP